jgi:3-(3-hydroxy-phenyl)propionate hydroxylase
VLLRTPTLWRVLFPADPFEPAAERRGPPRVRPAHQGALPQGGAYEIFHAIAYRVQQRVADRIALVGDAAHLDNPPSGMGLNGGCHDAVELAMGPAKIRGGADAARRLACYQRRRRRVALDVVQERSIRNRRMMAETEPSRRRAVHDEMRRAAEDPEAHRAFVLRSSMIRSLRDAEAA